MLTHIGREEVHDHVTEIHDEPALARLPFHASLFLVVLFRGFEHALGKRVQHAVTGAITNDKIISKRCDTFDVEKQDVFALFVLQGIDDFMCKIESVQISPQNCHSEPEAKSLDCVGDASLRSA